MELIEIKFEKPRKPLPKDCRFGRCRICSQVGSVYPTGIYEHGHTLQNKLIRIEITVCEGCWRKIHGPRSR